MNLRLALLTSAVLLAAAAGCYTGSAVDANRGPGAPASETDATEPTDDPDAESSVIPAKPTGMPCEVATVLTASCTECHGARLRGGAPNHLLTYDDLAATSESDPEKTVAELSVIRMRSTKRPMPPDGKLGADRIALFEKWVTDGMPRGMCGEKPVVDAGPDTKPKDGGPKDAASDASSVCTSGTVSPAGSPPSALMKPGQACIACHSAAGGPVFEIAGTVYPSLHEPNGCNGASAVKVIIIDATGTPHSMATNAAGNFYRVASFPRPYRAMVVRGTDVREMKTPQTDGDCNGCHTEWGNKSPGRVMAP